MKIGQTITEKIFSRYAKKMIFAGDFVVSEPDFIMAHDTTCAWAIDPFYRICKKVNNPGRIHIFFDHAYPCPSVATAEMQVKIREFAFKQKLKIITEGICHQLLAEKYVKPGDLVLGADSHTPTVGAMGVVAVGMGSTDIAIAMATGKTWFKVPATIRINIEGVKPKHVYAKDIILKVAKRIGTEGANYKAIEFGGSVISNLAMHDRLTITNMASELGCKIAIIEPDDKTLQFLKENNREKDIRDALLIQSDLNCSYEKVIDIDITNLKPQIALPHDIDNVVNVDDIANEKIIVNQVFIGSCTNGRLEDLEVICSILDGKKIANNIRLIVTPVSKTVYLAALRKGYIASLCNSGAIITSYGCGACLGRHGGVLAANEVCVATSNRNFQGRMGSMNAKIYLSSPATAATTALNGYISC